jgi:hypothetical protein
MSADRFNFAIDPLYGCYKLSPLVRALVVQPEVQRLRDVRLSNINSMFILGSANISRYEHSLGVAYLAAVAADKRSTLLQSDLGFNRVRRKAGAPVGARRCEGASEAHRRLRGCFRTVAHGVSIA